MVSFYVLIQNGRGRFPIAGCLLLFIPVFFHGLEGRINNSNFGTSCSSWSMKGTVGVVAWPWKNIDDCEGLFLCYNLIFKLQLIVCHIIFFSSYFYLLLYIYLYHLFFQTVKSTTPVSKILPFFLFWDVYRKVKLLIT